MILIDRVALAVGLGNTWPTPACYERVVNYRPKESTLRHWLLSNKFHTGQVGKGGPRDSFPFISINFWGLLLWAAAIVGICVRHEGEQRWKKNSQWISRFHFRIRWCRSIIIIRSSVQSNGRECPVDGPFKSPAPFLETWNLKKKKYFIPPKNKCESRPADEQF